MADLAGKQPAITEGGLAQNKVTNLVADLGAKALQADLVSGLAGKEPTITEGGLAQSKVTNLVANLAAKASTQQLADGLEGRHPLITVTATLPQALLTDLTSALAARQPLLNDSSQLVVDTVSSRLYLGDVFRSGKQIKAVRYLQWRTTPLGLNLP